MSMSMITDSRVTFDPDILSRDKIFELGMYCSLGRDGVMDLVNAHKWFNIAAIQGKKEAIEYRKAVASELTSDQLAEAQRAAREWLQSQ